MITKLCLVERAYLSPGAMAAAHQKSYLLLHRKPLPWIAVKVIGTAICIMCLVLNIPAGMVVGAGIAWYASGRGKA